MERVLTTLLNLDQEKERIFLTTDEPVAIYVNNELQTVYDGIEFTENVERYCYEDYFELTTAPIEEDCVQVGVPEYDPQRIRIEAKAFRSQLVRTFGNPPDHAGFRLVSCDGYPELRVYYDTKYYDACVYALKCVDETPERWDATARKELKAQKYFEDWKPFYYSSNVVWGHMKSREDWTRALAVLNNSNYEDPYRAKCDIKDPKKFGFYHEHDGETTLRQYFIDNNMRVTRR